MIPIQASAGEDAIVPVLEAPKYRRKMRAPISQKVDLFFVQRSRGESQSASSGAGTGSGGRREAPPASRTRGPGMIFDAVA